MNEDEKMFSIGIVSFIVVMVALRPGVKSLSQSLKSIVSIPLVNPNVNVIFAFSLSLIG